MSKYYRPELVEKHGKRLYSDRARDGYIANRRVALMYNGLFKTAVDVTASSEYDYFYTQYFSGMWLTFLLYDYDPSNETDI